MTNIVSLVDWFIDLWSHWLIGLLVTVPGVQAMFQNIGPSTWKPFPGNLSGARLLGTMFHQNIDSIFNITVHFKLLNKLIL